tara:strand:- start:2851 stop:3129 length:279 start_codon:yes stop_codon:yes gene_type:complete
MAVKIVRMLSGEDVLCDCEESEDHFQFQDAVVVVPTQQSSVQFVPYSPFGNKDPLKINKNMVVFVTEPDNSLLNQHKKMFGGIITPDSGMLA